MDCSGPVEGVCEVDREETGTVTRLGSRLICCFKRGLLHRDYVFFTAEDERVAGYFFSVMIPGGYDV